MLHKIENASGAYLQAGEVEVLAVQQSSLYSPASGIPGVVDSSALRLSPSSLFLSFVKFEEWWRRLMPAADRAIVRETISRINKTSSRINKDTHAKQVHIHNKKRRF